ncbi:site-2 protease family protein [Paenibacillus sp. CC-CFT747]|nr:site-2 protease family protein [Paenibacillus sp. CC-CFT747]
MSKSRVRSALLAVGAFIVAKFKWVLAFLKFSKFGGTLISMGISLWAYAFLYGWKFAAAVIYLIFVHEMGHVIAARIKGIKTSPAVFLPFVGAFIAMKEQPRDAKTEAFLAYGGPLAGLLSFLPAVALYEWTKEPFWIVVVFTGALINLFNLLPISPLDGGRIVSVLSTRIWFFGLLGLGALLVYSPDPMIFLIFLLGLFSWWGRGKEATRQEILAYEQKKLREFLDDLETWPTLSTTYEKKVQLQAAAQASPGPAAGGRRWSIPLLDDGKKIAAAKAEIDRRYASAAYELLLKWEWAPVQYEDGDLDRPVPSTMLAEASRSAAERLTQVEEELARLSTYYKSPASTKWKVLIAYLALAVVLSLFFLYANDLSEIHRSSIR